MRKLPDTITREEFEQVIAKTKRLKLKAAFMFGFWQCMRVSEVCNINRENVNTKTGFIRVKQGKGKKDRDIPIMPEVLHYVRYLPIGISRQGLHKAIKTKTKKVLGKDIHFHTLRHSGASYYLNERAIDLRFIQGLLGHESISTTQIYTHVNPVQLKRAFENGSKSNQM